MKKLLFLILCLVLISVLFVFDFSGIGNQGLSSVNGITSCAEDYAPSLTESALRAVGTSNTLEYTGFLYTPSSNECVCAVDVYNGDYYTMNSGQYVWMRIYAIDGSNQLDSVSGTSDASLPGDELVENTWFSANVGKFVFSTCVELTASTTYAIAVFPDQDSDPNDDPEIDSDEYWAWGIDDENNGDAIQGGRYTWSHGASYPYAVQSFDSQDDMMVKIWTQ